MFGRFGWLMSISCGCICCREADALNVSNCTTEKKRELFTIARQAFSGTTRSTVSTSSYQLTRTYMGRQTETHIRTHAYRTPSNPCPHCCFLFSPAGGATLDYVRSLAASDVDMDLATFTSMEEQVVQVSAVYVCVCVLVQLSF